jgi:glycosyltransferase involved in cell wall biosynthesis
MDRKIKVLHIITGLNTGGAEGMLLRLVSAMEGHTHVVVSLTTLGKLGPEFLAKEIQVIALDTRRSSLGLVAIWKLRRLIREIRPDIIQTWMYHSDLLGGIAGRLAGVKNVVWNIRIAEVSRKAYLTRLVVKLGAITSCWVPRKIICCAYAALETHAALGYCREHMVVIQNGYDVKDFPLSQESMDSRRHALGLPPKVKIVGIVGRYDPQKGYDLFIKAAGLLAASNTEDVLFLMVGRGVVETNEELQRWIVDFGGKARFKFMGERRDISRIMSVLDVYCLSSLFEGFPNVVAEAMLMQVPCVVTDVGDAKRIVGETGWVVPSNAPIALADALQTVLNMTEKERQARGWVARQRIVENYGMEKIAAQYSNLYQQCLGNY